MLSIAGLTTVSSRIKFTSKSDLKLATDCCGFLHHDNRISFYKERETVAELQKIERRGL